jgi:hypothetical protein
VLSTANEGILSIDLVRYLKMEMYGTSELSRQLPIPTEDVSHEGPISYCTLTQLKVFGKSVHYVVSNKL